MAQHEFRIDIALPRLAALERLGPWPGSCVEYAPVAWNELGPDFAIAFLKAHERKHWPRQTAIKSDISVYPERDAMNPANDPCVHCRVNGEYVHCLACDTTDE